MSKINATVEILKQYPEKTTKELSLIVAEALQVPRQQAYAYMFNARKKLGTGVVKAPKGPSAKAQAAVAAASKSAKKAKASEEFKERRLEQMKEVSSRMAKVNAEREKMQADIDTLLEESDEYIASLKSEFLRKAAHLSA